MALRGGGLIIEAWPRTVKTAEASKAARQGARGATAGGVSEWSEPACTRWGTSRDPLRFVPDAAECPSGCSGHGTCETIPELAEDDGDAGQARHVPSRGLKRASRC